MNGQQSPQRVAIVTDSIACLPQETARQYGVRVVPLNIYFEGKVYREGIEITPAEAYALLARAPDQFRTSPGSVEDYVAAYRDVAARFQAIVCVTISSGLSTLYNVAQIARKQVMEEIPGVTIELVDSATAAAGETLIVLAAARAALAGSDLAGVVAAAERVKSKVITLGIFETIRYVHRTGRVPKIASQMLGALNIRPLFTISGMIRIISVDISKRRGVRRLVDRMREKVGTNPVHVAISHANVPEEGENLREEVASEFNCVELVLTDFSPVMGYSTGEGTLVIAFYEE